MESSSEGDVWSDVTIGIIALFCRGHALLVGVPIGRLPGDITARSCSGVNVPRSPWMVSMTQPATAAAPDVSVSIVTYDSADCLVDLIAVVDGQQIEDTPPDVGLDQERKKVQ